MTMIFFDRYFNLKIAVVDLAAREAQILPLDREVVAEHLGGAALNAVLFEQFRNDNPLVLGVGPLTGSFAPGSCLLVATFKRAADGELCHTPLMLRAGPGLKFSGFDFLVIKGGAATAQKLVVANNSIQFLPAQDLVAQNIPESCQIIQRQYPAGRYTTVLTGPAADQGSADAMVSLDTAGSLDRGGMAAWMADKKLKAIILQGGGGLPFEADHLGLKVKMLHALTAGRPFKGSGCLDVLAAIGLPETARASVTEALQRNLACYNCPVACLGYATLPKSERSAAGPSETVVVADHSGLLALARTRDRECLMLYKESRALGLDPVAVALTLTPQMNMDQLLETVRCLAGRGIDRQLPRPGTGRTSAFVRGDVPAQDHLKFGAGLPPIVSGGNQQKGTGWKDRVALAMILGVCPILLLRFPEISSDALVEFVGIDPVERTSFEQRLAASIQAL